MILNEKAKSQQQLKLIYAKRNQYGSKSETPEKWKWVWDEEWTDDVKFKELPEKVEESNGISLNQEMRDEYIDFIMNSSMDDRKDLERMSDDNLEERYYEVVDFLQAHPIDPNAHMEEWLPEDDENERFITKFDSFINEAKKEKKPKKTKGQKLSFVDWWSKSFEKKADYWVEKKEINQGYQPNELTHYYERKMKSKYNKYLKNKRK